MARAASCSEATLFGEWALLREWGRIGNAGWQRDLSVSQDRIGDVLRAQGNLPAALEVAYPVVPGSQTKCAKDSGHYP